MDALSTLTQRVSVAQLTGPDITSEQLQWLLQAALRAADHGWMRPSRFITVQGDARARLGRVFLEATANWQSLPEDKQQKLLNMPMRAPLVLVAVCTVQSQVKVPELDQLLSTGAAVQNILNAAWALGLGAIWRTGDMAENPQVAKALGLQTNERIVGFVYLGHASVQPRSAPVMDVVQYVQDWQGPKA